MEPATATSAPPRQWASRRPRSSGSPGKGRSTCAATICAPNSRMDSRRADGLEALLERELTREECAEILRRVLHLRESVFGVWKVACDSPTESFRRLLAHPRYHQPPRPVCGHDLGRDLRNMDFELRVSRALTAQESRTTSVRRFQRRSRRHRFTGGSDPPGRLALANQRADHPPELLLSACGSCCLGAQPAYIRRAASRGRSSE
jgi:hypothetical protein